jgi:hypothetical protein
MDASSTASKSLILLTTISLRSIFYGGVLKGKKVKKWKIRWRQEEVHLESALAKA